MDILHIASFSGNIGDVINHEGFYTFLRRCGIDFHVTQLELRKFYYNCRECRFDLDFLKYLNQFDAVVIGGGGFFDLRWNESATGTTLDMSQAFIAGIKIPILFNALGFHPEYGKEYENAYLNFSAMLKQLNEKEQCMVTLRNDGSLNRMKKIYDYSFCDSIRVVPDGGFFFPVNSMKCGKGKDKTIIGINISKDLFRASFTNNVTEGDFIDDALNLINWILNNKYNIMFFPHTPQDLEVVYQLYSRIEKKYFRDQIMISSYFPYGVEGAKMYESYYNMCDVVIAMRFHANILALDKRIPTIALAGHEQVQGLYEELGLIGNCVVVGEKDYIAKIKKLINQMLLEDRRCNVDLIYEKLEEDYLKYIRQVKEMLN